MTVLAYVNMHGQLAKIVHAPSFSYSVTATRFSFLPPTQNTQPNPCFNKLYKL